MLQTCVPLPRCHPPPPQVGQAVVPGADVQAPARGAGPANHRRRDEYPELAITIK